MCVRKCWRILPLNCELRQVPDNLGQLGKQEVNCIPHENELCVVSDVAAGSLLRMQCQLGISDMRSSVFPVT